ncbi:DegV family protein [Clostridium sp. B9]|uniref:DegV family protein n=1 Tax=Clostridium sp. B9 TaxID=3423224 RepID=UPI003D2F433B
MAVKVITDSTSCIPKELAEKYGIEIVSLSVIMNGESYKEVEIDSEAFYAELDKCDKLPTSSQPSMEEFYNAFEKFAKDGHDIVAAFISSKLSGTYTTSHIIKSMILENYPDTKIDLIDSHTSVMALGIGVIEGAKAAQEGKDFDEVSRIVRETIEESEIVFIPGTLDNLKKGGRIGGAAALFGKVLKINPILTVKEGAVVVMDKVRTKKRAIDKIVDTVSHEIKEHGIKKAVVCHILAEDEAIDLAKRLKDELDLDTMIGEISAVIGVHVGVKSVGIAYARES